MGGFSGQPISQAPDEAGPKVLAVVVTLHTPAVAASTLRRAERLGPKDSLGVDSSAGFPSQT